MSREMKPGDRLRSVSDDTEVVVVRPPDTAVDLRCGGHAMVSADEESEGGPAPEPEWSEGTLLGKRYHDEATGLEVLCVQAGAGSLSLGDESLPVKGAKPLPSSD